MEELQTTPVRDYHEALGARMTPFAGWLMPIQYTDGILAEHQHTREQVSLFDCCHMGQFRITGNSAAAELDALMPRLSSTLRPGRCRYNFLLADDGTVIDDLLVYRLAENEFMLVVNAGTQNDDAAHVQAHLSAELMFRNESRDTAKFDLQGPGMDKVLAKAGFDLEQLPRYFAWTQAEVAGIPCLLSRTGYTGERGVELYFSAARAGEMWQALLDISPTRPAGLGARDTLRLEMGYPLYGHELSRSLTPLEAGFGDLIHWDHEFVGREALRRREPKVKGIGICLNGRRAARAGAEVQMAGKTIGTVSSGSFSPSLKTAVALAFLQVENAVAGRSVQVAVGRGMAEGTLVQPPFYRQGSVR